MISGKWKTSIAVGNNSMIHIGVICFVDVPDNPLRPPQPLFIGETRYACEQRINEYITKYGNIENSNTFIISIENGILSVDTDQDVYENISKNIIPAI